MSPLLHPAHSQVQAEPLWRSGQVLRSAAPRELRPWLERDGSLTRALIAASHNQFSVTLLNQSLARVNLSERRALGLRPKQLAVVREVLLCGGGTPWVFARSVLPLSSLKGRLRSLRHLDNRPLGELLFTTPGMHRDPFQLSAIDSRHRYLPRAQGCDRAQWARRSIFWLYGKPLLVSEVFLDAFRRQLLSDKA